MHETLETLDCLEGEAQSHYISIYVSVDAKISHLANKHFLKWLHLNVCYSGTLYDKLTTFGI